MNARARRLARLVFCLIAGMVMSQGCGCGAVKSGRPMRIKALGMDLVWVEPGRFSMGSNDGSSDEKPIRTVAITRGYWVGKTEVTNSQYQLFVRESGYNGLYDADKRYLKHISGGCNMPTTDEHPVVWVSWYNAVAFCSWVTERELAAGRLPEGYVYRLPTEAEWEYAGRGGRHGREISYAGSNEISAVAWYDSNSGRRTKPVGMKEANELGLNDMSGNVFEWVHDWYQESYDDLPNTDPAGPGTGSYRVIRGGSCYCSAFRCRVAYRDFFTPSNLRSLIGFRVVLAPPL